MARLADLALPIVLALSIAACASDRGDPSGGLPGASSGSVALPVGTVGADARAAVDALAANFTEGVHLALRLEELPAACVAERWVAVLGAAPLEAAGIAADELATITLNDLEAARQLDRAEAMALIDAFAECGARYESAFLTSLVATGDITVPQRVCLAEALPDGLLESISISVLADGAGELDPALSASFDQAIATCPP